MFFIFKIFYLRERNLIKIFNIYTLYLNKNFGEKRTERKEKGRKEKKVKRNKGKITLICIGGDGREIKGDDQWKFPFKTND